MKDHHYRYPGSVLVHIFKNLRVFRRGMGFAILRTLMLAPLPWLFRLIIDTHVATANIPALLVTALIVVGLLFLHYAFAVAGASEISRENGRLMLRLRSDIFNKLHFLAFGYLDRQKTGRLLSKYAFDTQRIEMITMQLINQFVPQMLYSLTLSTVLVLMHWQLALLLLALVPIYGFTHSLFHRRLKQRQRQTRLAQERLTGAASEAINALRLVRSFGEEDQVTENIDQFSYRLTHSRFNVTVLNTMFNAFAHTMVQLFTLLSLAGGAYFAIRGAITMGTLFAFMAALPVVLSPVQMITGLIEQYYVAQEGYFSVKELLDSTYVEDWQGTREIKSMTGRLTFEAVSFAYPQTDIQVLKQFTLEIAAGSHVALVGPSGSGKSTVAQLVLGLYKPQEGRILVDGIPQADLSMRWLRQQSAVVLQDILLFSGTVADNIRFAQPNASDEQVREAARMANADQFISELSKGYETIVGERGVMISGGQRQRLSIARAILRNPRLLILDEATSALDYESEHLVQEALLRVATGRTVITIAHRLSTIRAADWIVVMRQGRIIEQGTYSELAQQAGLFAHLLRMQNEPAG